MIIYFTIVKKDEIDVTRNSFSNNKIENVSNGLVAILNLGNNKFHSNNIRKIPNEKIVI